MEKSRVKGAVEGGRSKKIEQSMTIDSAEMVAVLCLRPNTSSVSLLQVQRLHGVGLQLLQLLELGVDDLYVRGVAVGNDVVLARHLGLVHLGGQGAGHHIPHQGHQGDEMHACHVSYRSGEYIHHVRNSRPA